MITADEALKILIEGNRRYSDGKAEHPHQSSQRRSEVLSVPHPVAALLSCADSRVPPEICFDQGIGDLFVIRTAGNIVDDLVLGSIEFGVKVFDIPLVVVLGHTRCGAVMAAVDGSETPGHVGKIVAAIRPAIELSKDLPGDAVFNATVANVRQMVDQIITSQPVLAQMVHSGQLKVVGGIYHLDSGLVDLL
jgi:carbonic anhydrase